MKLKMVDVLEIMMTFLKDVNGIIVDLEKRT